MPDHDYKQIEIIGTAGTSIEDAVAAAIARANNTVHHLHGIQVKDARPDRSNLEAAVE